MMSSAMNDDQICTSADKVGSNDDLLIEILLRLPVISLRLFKCVSKRWLSIITDHNFTMLRSRNVKFDPPTGLFLELICSPKFVFFVI